jgi:processing peptidase subunit alpha
MKSLARHQALLRVPALRRCAWGAPELAQIPGVPLNVPLYDEPPAAAPSTSLVPTAETKITTLPNGLKVVSQADASAVATIGVVVNAGSRYETAANSGASYMLQLAAFTSTASRSHFKMVRDIEATGAQVACTAGREQMVYSATCLKGAAKEVVEMLAQTTLEPSFVEWELAEKKGYYAHDVAELPSNPLAFVTEKMHTAGYSGATLGMPLMAGEKQLAHLTPEVLGAFMEARYTPAAMVVAGAGVEHDALVAYAKAAFGGVPAGAAAGGGGGAAKWTGGDYREAVDSDVTQFGLGFEGVGWRDADFVPACVLNMLMGGGASFSAGGPGKGMFSRLYLNVLNKYPFALNATTSTAVHSDSGVFLVHGTAPNGHVGALASVLVEEMANMAAKPFREDEVARAKKQLKSSLYMNLESSPILFEDLGRQVATYGQHTGPRQLAAQIEAVTPAKLSEVARRILKSAPTVVAYGDTTAVPRYDLIAKNLA